MKKLISLVLAFVLALGIAMAPAMAEGELKTGLAAVASLGKSASATESAEGLAQTDAAVVAVTVDQDGKIVNCVIDTIQAKINFDAQGQVTTDLASVYKSKNELGDEYGMRPASGIGKEWFEQAAALSEYVVGKTAEEVLAIGMNEEKYPTDADLTASVTMKIDGLVAAIANAVETAQPLGASAGDVLGLGIVTDAASSANAAEDKDGKAQSYSHMAAVTYNDQGVITSCVIDALQGVVNFDAVGAITSDVAAVPQTKNVLGDGYGMRAASPIGKEWFEQAAAFSAYVTGKTAEDVSAIAMENGKATDADLLSGATVTISSMVEVVVKALAK